MTVRRLREGDDNAAVRVVEDLKFRMDEVAGVSVDSAYMRGFLADDRHYFIVAFVEMSRPAMSSGIGSPALTGDRRRCSSTRSVWWSAIGERGSVAPW